MNDPEVPIVDAHRDPRAVGDWIDNGDGNWSVWDGSRMVPIAPRAAPGWLLTAIVAATGSHDCPVCNAGRPLPDGVTCPLCAGWTTI